MLEVWLPLFLCVVAAWAWHHVLRLRERATRHARELCERHGLQLLDDTVALHRLHARWQGGGLRVTREYRFDTSRGGDHRQSATLTVHGGRVVASSLPSIEPAAADVPVATTPFIPASLPRGEAPSGNVVPFTRRERRTLH
ncbi:MAG TPA: DUF3301 domain-containing protein [Rhodanobacteraceae bacterium]|nr:DUF3301 domain-containing protein [Rhodanobacteraceae bacterium]